MTDTTNKEKVVNMFKVRHFAAAGLFLALSVLAVSGMVVSAKRKTYGRLRWNDNDDRRW
ncbi:MAG: hypothetical protein K1W35_23960 [Lachnospiraceae bacterium]